ncbi:hypothetical protein Vafri_21668 [Volvox africanus]|uniref:Peptidase M11 gametolysin domain-containing protein n=1 Tax=Volvox africanus TaxID=51714 RepID=A0A8J4FBS2_9CHLO|nr:hypothetical protein Vafri_21668 [Volvox africanus]
MAPANCDSRWTFGLLPYPWQRRFQRFLLLLLPLVATSLLAWDGASVATPPSPVPQSPPALTLTAGPLLLRPPPLQPTIATSVLRIYIQGKLQYRPTKPIGTWVLTSINGSSGSFTLPNQPVDVLSGQEIFPGWGVSLTCFLPNTSTTSCSNITNARIIQAVRLAQATNITLSMLVMVLSLSNSSECNSRGGANVTQVRNAFLVRNNYADFFRNCSYGMMVLDKEKLTVVSTVMPCSAEIINCNVDAIANNAAKFQLIAGIQVTSYSHFVYVLPDNLTCGWGGLGDLPGTQSWFTADKSGIFSKGTVMQEILHNFGLYHSWKDWVEYDDYSTAMGSGDSCPSAPELWRLGWATPLAQLNSSSFPLATYKNFTLPATYLSPRGVMIKIQPDWLGELYTKNMYLALRVKMAGDRDLIEQFNGKLNIHELNKSIDNSFLAERDPKISFMGALDPGSSVIRFDYKLHLLVGVFDSKISTIIVTLCRFVTGPNECTADAPSTSLPSPPKPPSPMPPSPWSPPPSPTNPPSPMPPSPRSPPPSPPNPPSPMLPSPPSPPFEPKPPAARPPFTPCAIELGSSYIIFAGPNVGSKKPFRDPQAMVIWMNGDVSSASKLIAATFTTTITIAGQATQALLHVIINDIADIYVNGAYITTVERGRLSGEYTDRPVNITLPVGTSTLSLRVMNTDGGPSGVAAYLISSDGSSVLTRTNRTWTYTIDAQDAPGAIELGSSFVVFAWPNVGLNKSFSDPKAMAIWINGDASSTSTLITTTFTTTITIAGQATQALLYVILNDIADIYVNGAYITYVLGGWFLSRQFTNQPINITLPVGTSTLSLRILNTAGGPAAVAAYLLSSDGSSVLTRTNSAWTYTIDADYAPSAIELGSSFVVFAWPNVGSNKSFSDPKAMAIWINGDASSTSTLITTTFTTTITIAGQATQALLYVILNDIADIYVNGAYITYVLGGWFLSRQFANQPINITLPVGTSTLSLRILNTAGGPAAVAAYLLSSDGSSVLTRTNSAWTYTIDADNAPSAIELGSSFVVFAGPNVGSNKPFSDPKAMAIWVHENATSSTSTLIAATFTTTITITGQATQALLYLIVDDIAEIYVNGAYITYVAGGRLSGEYTDRPVNITLPVGTSTLSLRVKNTGGPAGVAAYLRRSRSSSVLTRTNRAWTYTIDAQDAASAIELGSSYVVFAGPNVGSNESFSDPQAMVIWVHENATSSASTLLAATFTTTITIGGSGTQALLYLIVDDIAEVYVNGAYITTVAGGWLSREYTDRPVNITLPVGTSTLSLRVKNTGGPAGVAAYLRRSSRNSSVLTRTNRAWTYTIDAQDAASAIELGSSYIIFAGPNVGSNKSFSDPKAMAISINGEADFSASTLIAATFTTTITITGQATQALLHIIVNDIAEVYVNGAYITTVERGWLSREYTDRPVNITLPVGTSTLSLRVKNTGGPPEVAAYLRRSSRNSSVLTRTNRAWTYTIDAQDARSAIELGSSYVVFAGPNVGSNKPFSDPQAMVIWVHENATSSASTLIAATFTTTITIGGSGTQALMYLIVDDIAEVYVNGAYITTVAGGWLSREYTDRPVNITLPVGTSTLSLRIKNTGGPAGVAAYLISRDGSFVLTRTNSTWTYTIDAQDAPSAIELGSSFVVFAGPNVGSNKPFSDPQAMAIWVHENATSSASTLIAATFTTTITITGQATQALLYLIVDDIAEVYINGAYITYVERGWLSREYTDRPINITLPVGTSTLSLRVKNTGGPAGVAAYLISSDGSSVLTRTNIAWTYTFGSLV